MFLSIKLNFSSNEDRLLIKIKLFGLTIINAYAKIINEGIVIHLTRKKAILVFYNDLFYMKNKVEPLKDYHLLSAKFDFTFGAFDDYLTSISSCFILNYCEQIFKWILKYNKPYFKLRNIYNVNLDLDYSTFCFKGLIVFNLLMILLSFIKIFIGKVKYAISK